MKLNGRKCCWGKLVSKCRSNLLFSKVCSGDSSSPSRQSICLSPSASLGTHTPVLQRKASFLHADEHIILWNTGCTKISNLFMHACLVYLCSTSRHCGHHNHRLHHKSAPETHTCHLHIWSHTLCLQIQENKVTILENSREKYRSSHNVPIHSGGVSALR